MKVVSVLLALLCSCVIADSEDEAATSEVAQQLRPDCDEWGCGTNSPNVDSFGFHELSERGLPNAQGFYITRFEKNGVDYKIDVSKGHLRGLRSTGTLYGNALVGAQIWVNHKSAGAYVIRIADVAGAPLWAKLTSQSIWVETYLLKWTRVYNGVPSTRWLNTCQDPIKDMGMQAYHSVLFEGDRIDAKAKKLFGVDTSWFNVGCAGSTLAKMYLTGHTEASIAYGFTTTLDERQTALKMFSADFCGDGAAFTVGGTPLQWMDDKGWMDYTGPVKLEARWTAAGASCLNTPRITDLALIDVGDYPDIDAALLAHCGYKLPACEPDDTDPKHHLTSALPVL